LETVRANHGKEGTVRGSGTVELHIVPNAGHWLHVDNPAFLLELISQNLY
jgi:pimeloyl-ACP methyl ester carboxylesterase